MRRSRVRSGTSEPCARGRFGLEQKVATIAL
jgi:hypothetical protein